MLALCTALSQSLARIHVYSIAVFCFCFVFLSCAFRLKTGLAKTRPRERLPPGLSSSSSKNSSQMTFLLQPFAVGHSVLTRCHWLSLWPLSKPDPTTRAHVSDPLRPFPCSLSHNLSWFWQVDTVFLICHRLCVFVCATLAPHLVAGQQPYRPVVEDKLFKQLSLTKDPIS